ncbi:unnamed protein product [Chilo suppressalis]|uniref:Exocyst complex component Sec8 n=1 Tax=Chilo suppressalis TaxID=168631 RepID=A0ABN8BC60_CHISP|nr:hypothetical protein evm_008780 [Chilo suppressalis]CAH0407558.1 unnamed protein product [Chilo suppressalis]
MSSPPPTKPPRGVKQGKETSGLLMSVIRTLSASETNEQREKERAKLEKEYKKSDARLDELVAAHAQEIMEVMQKFSSVSTAMTVWGQHCDAAVARLAACRGLLQLRRDDLKRLWADARTHHYALQMLTDIERVVVSERETRELISAGRVLAAAYTLRTALDTADTSLSHVDALHSTRQHLDAKKRELVEVIVRRISEAVYRGDRSPLLRRVSARRRTALLLSELTKNEEVTDAHLQDITPEFEASLSEEDKTFETTVMISLEALGVLELLKEATEKFKVQIQNELLDVIDSVSRRIIDEVDVEAEVECEEDGDTPDAECVTETARPLARLVATLGQEFRACAARNKRLLQLWRAALQRHKISDSYLHTEQHYWSAVQQVFQLLLTEYLDIESVNLAAVRSTGAANSEVNTELRLADYFAKKKPQRRRAKLFKLNAGGGACPGVGVNPAGARRRLVCRAEPAHLHALLPHLHALCAHIEALHPGGECSLRAFVTDYVRSGEGERLATAARTAIDTAMRAPSAWRQTVRAPPSGSRHRIIFACCAEGWQAVVDAALAAKRCGPCGGVEALRATTGALAALATQCRAAHARMTPGASGTGGSRATRWLADDDIVRFLQSLPNWRALSDPAPTPAQELKQAYEREAEILGSSLGDGAVTRREIVADVNVLADLAMLCETMDWLSTNIKTIPSIVSGTSTTGGGIRLTDKFVNDINSAAMIFEEISHKCLLFLHLELRIECFYYLGQEERAEGTEEGGPEAGGAARLAHALLAFHEHAAAILAPNATAYVFGGLGEMMSAGVVWRWQGGEVSAAHTSSATARLATLRHALAALQLPHDGLHRAHAYLHLLACEPGEIISSVREKGAQFSELEYLNAFKVIGARRGLSPADMRAQLKHLSTALGHVGVTV